MNTRNRISLSGIFLISVAILSLVYVGVHTADMENSIESLDKRLRDIGYELVATDDRILQINNRMKILVPAANYTEERLVFVEEKSTLVDYKREIVQEKSRWLKEKAGLEEGLVDFVVYQTTLFNPFGILLCVAGIIIATVTIAIPQSEVSVSRVVVDLSENKQKGIRFCYICGAELDQKIIHCPSCGTKRYEK